MPAYPNDVVLCTGKRNCSREMAFKSQEQSLRALGPESMLVDQRAAKSRLLSEGEPHCPRGTKTRLVGEARVLMRSRAKPNTSAGIRQVLVSAFLRKCQAIMYQCVHLILP